MKKHFIFGLAAILFFGGTAIAQDIPQSQVPAGVVSNFQKAFPNATDVEWEMDGHLYKVEFEIGTQKFDHDVWYDDAGQLLKHKEEISRNSLPRQVAAVIKQEFKGYRIDDVEKITEGDKVTYKLEVKSRTEEWNLTLDADGNVLTKVAD